MKPSQQFQNMIAMLYQSRQKTISNLDLIKHRDNEVAFYSISKMVVNGLSVKSQTEAFSDQTFIEIDKGANNLNVIKENKVLKYRRISPMEFTIHEGKGLLYWKVQHMILQDFIVVKLMSEDGCVQIKLISEDQQTQTIYNVCELPSQFNRTF